MKQNSFFQNEPTSTPQQILTRAIDEWEPRAIVALFSGGYDSAIVTHLSHSLDTHGLPIHVWSIDTKMAADGWHDYVWSVADMFGWDFVIYDNEKGFQQFFTLVAHIGCPWSRKLHTNVYQKLKERGIDAIHMLYKEKVSDKTLFISGMRRAESDFRKSAPEAARVGHSNKIFVAPIVHWSNEECDLYRVENGLPDNPFYGTVKGSGDCQCNWGDFIDMDTLRKYSPELAAGNVAIIDRLSKDLHGFGWHSADIVKRVRALAASHSIANIGEALTTPFLCHGCSRAKVRATTEDIENVILQRGLFDIL